MVKKKFIDKKRSVTYSLVYRSTEDPDAPLERELMEAGRGSEAAGDPDLDADAQEQQQGPARRYPPGHPLAWLEEEELQGEMSEERRKELIELGFPDDGYDYIKHMRVLGHGKGSLEGLEQQKEAPSTSETEPIVVLGGKAPAVKETGPVGPGVFMKATSVQQPEVDVAVFDAARLTVIQPTEAEEEAAELMGGVTAFSRRKDTVALGAERRDIEELEELMAALEADDDLDVEIVGEEDVEEAQAIGDGVAVKGRVLGEGDLLDDFILSATQGDGGDDGEEEEDYEEVEVEWSEEEESYDGSDGGAWSSDEAENEDGLGELGEFKSKGKAPPKPGSIASTYWRDERHDRKNLLEVIDERFEHTALEYDEDEIGSMEDAAEAGDIQGFADVHDFDAILNEFLNERRAMGPADDDEEEEEVPEAVELKEGQEESKEKKKVYAKRRKGESILKARLEAAGFDDADAEVAIRAARAAIRRMEEEEASGKVIGVELETEIKEVDPTAGWDCETILSLRSNLYNHPATITEPGRPSRAPPQGVIKLNKFGIPVGMLPQRGAGEDSKEREAAVMLKKKPAPAAVERKKGETAEEKKARKAAVKEAKREARATKKELKSLYKEESVKAQRRAATAQVQPSVLL